MARIKRSVNALKKRRKVMKLAKGYWGAKSKQYRAASEQVARSLRYAFKGRKLRKRDFRSLWITRINAAAFNIGRVCAMKRLGDNYALAISTSLVKAAASFTARSASTLRLRSIPAFFRPQMNLE